MAMAVSLVALLFLSGCGAAYSGYMGRSLRQLEKGDYEGALARLEKPGGKTNTLLYYLEKGLICTTRAIMRHRTSSSNAPSD